MTRHPGNPNLHLYSEPMYDEKFPLMTRHAPFVKEYLDALFQTLTRAIKQHKRLMALRVDLIIPKAILAQMPEAHQRLLITRFLESLKAQIEADRRRAKRNSRRAAECTLRYVWCREFSGMKRFGLHYHFLLLFNKDAYFTPGRVGQGGDSLANRISKAWYRALGLEWNPSTPLIHLPRNGCYVVDGGFDYKGAGRLFERASYLCKADTKLYGDHRHAFGCSRV